MWGVGAGSEDDYAGLHDDGPICIEDDEAPLLPHHTAAGADSVGGGSSTGLSLGMHFAVAFLLHCCCFDHFVHQVQPLRVQQRYSGSAGETITRLY